MKQQELYEILDGREKIKTRLKIIKTVNNFINEIKALEQEYCYRWALSRWGDLRQVHLNLWSEHANDSDYWLDFINILESVASNKLIEERIKYSFGELALDSDNDMRSMLHYLSRLERKIAALELIEDFESVVWKHIPDNLTYKQRWEEAKKLLDKIEPDLLDYYSERCGDYEDEDSGDGEE